MAFQYLGLRARLEHVDVTEEEVNRQLVRLQQQSKRRTPVFDRPSQNGDELVLDYAGFADGKQFAGGTAEKQTLVLGSNTFIPGFEEQLLGKNPADGSRAPADHAPAEEKKEEKLIVLLRRCGHFLHHSAGTEDTASLLNALTTEERATLEGLLEKCLAHWEKH